MKYRLITIVFFTCFLSCDFINKKPKVNSSHNCMPSMVFSKNNPEDLKVTEFILNENTEGMIFVEGGEFEMGGDNNQAMQDEFPKHKVVVNSFWMDETEVTNDQFNEFVEETGFVTTAEKVIDWNEIKKILPPGTPKPHDSLMAPASLIFYEIETENMNDFTQWWKLEKNASWRNPLGKDSNINGKGNHPVIHISWDDALAYCKWAGKRLPTEAEFEYASRGGLKNNIYSWGNELIYEGKSKANTWEGKFPSNNNTNDQYYYTAPVKSFQPNAYGFYDLAGNVWEWCSDWYHSEYYKMSSEKTAINPKGPKSSYDPNEPYSPKKVMRGGSFLCNDSYCSGYRNSMRMKSTPDSSSMHAGFRTVVDVSN
ncbi:formylglycine-generating enzyme family protein [Flavobacteriaceae bacterium]|jgi:sulfatase modifying factor 1|nr:formylglycine-generating enzyme family protein [Flavobacteriaceae bacterium]